MKAYLQPLSEIWELLPIAIFACFLPVTMTLIEGQNSILLLMAMILVLVKLDHGDEFHAGLILGLASIKFQYVIPVAALFLIWRRWKFVSGVAVSSLALVAISVWLTGITGFLSYLRLLGSMSSHFSVQTGTVLGIRPELMPNLRGLVYAGGGPSLISTAVTLILSMASLLWTATRRASFPLALLAALLVSYHETFTDATLLILPVGLATTVAYKNNFGQSRVHTGAVRDASRDAGSLTDGRGAFLFDGNTNLGASTFVERQRYSGGNRGSQPRRRMTVRAG